MTRVTGGRVLSGVEYRGECGGLDDSSEDAVPVVMADQYRNQSPGMEVVNGHSDPSQSSLGDKTDSDMLEQIKQLLVENNKLKETMKEKNQEMKERLEDLLKREKLREEQGQSDIKAKQHLCELSHENSLLRKEIQQLKQTSEEEDMKLLKAQLVRLHAEKADLLGIISELQVKLSSCTSEDSFVEIRIAEKGIVTEMKEDKQNDGESSHDIISYRTRCSNDDNHAMESEELAVSKLLRSLREETEKVEQLQKELASANERLLQLEKKSLDISDKETETEPSEEKNEKEEFAEQLTLEVDNLKQKIEALNKELYETSEKLNEAQLLKIKLQDRCSLLDKTLLDNQVDLDERQKLLYSVHKLELQVESLQSEMKMERSKTEDQQKRIFDLEEALNKQTGDYELLRKAESEKVPKMLLLEVQKKLEACENALAKKQLEIDEMKVAAAKYQADSETIDVLRAQIDIYSCDFHAEREARQNLHQEKEQLATRLSYILKENEKLREERGRQSIEQLQRRHGSIRSEDGSNSPTLASRGAENMEQPSLTVHTCPKCQLMVPDMDTLQIHVMDCIT